MRSEGVTLIRSLLTLARYRRSRRLALVLAGASVAVFAFVPDSQAWHLYPHEYPCGPQNDGEIVWYDGYWWQCRYTSTWEWIIRGPGHGRPIIRQPAQVETDWNASWDVYAPRDPGRAMTLQMDYGDFSSDYATIPQGNGWSRFRFDHTFSEIPLGYRQVATILETGGYDVSVWVDP